MTHFISMPDNMPFIIALTVFLIIAVLEILSILSGMGISHIIDHYLSFDNSQLDIGFLSWLPVDRVPVTVLLIIFLLTFGCVGIGCQVTLYRVFGNTLSWPLLSIPVFITSLMSVRIFGSLIAKVIPRDETSAVSSMSLVGCVATITLGRASYQLPTQAKTKDEFGRTHYFLVAPDLVHEIFEQGEQVLLHRKVGAVYYAIKNNNL